MNEVTRILSAIEQGDPHFAEQLLPLVYEELRKLAAQKLANEKAGQSLEATALVHEAYLRLVTPPKSPPCEGEDLGGVHWNSRGHFFAAAAEAMRRILTERARSGQRIRRGGGRQRCDLDHLDVAAEETADDILALDEALERLAAEEPAAAQVVKLRYFAGLTIEQTAGLHRYAESPVNGANAHAAHLCRYRRLEGEGAYVPPRKPLTPNPSPPSTGARGVYQT